MLWNGLDGVFCGGDDEGFAEEIMEGQGVFGETEGNKGGVGALKNINEFTD